MATIMETKQTNAVPVPAGRSAGDLLRRFVGNRKLLALAALLVIGAGLALNWSWLVAAGVAPILLALAPCAAMCGLGICMQKIGGKSGSGDKGKPGADAGQNSKSAP